MEPLTGDCPLVVRPAVMVQRWQDLTFLHRSYDPHDVQRLLPAGLTVDTFDERAWVGLVPFRMWVSVPRSPALPWLSRFLETNVRTYVRDGHGRRGVWFFSLEASRLPAVVTARVSYRLPYFWADMSLEESPDQVRYRTSRRWPGPRGAGGELVVTPGDPVVEPTQLEHFLTARWRLFSHGADGRLRYADAQHSAWPLQRARLEQEHDSLIAVAGLPHPTGEPVVHFSRGVEVRIGRPHRVD